MSSPREYARGIRGELAVLGSIIMQARAALRRPVHGSVRQTSLQELMFGIEDRAVTALLRNARRRQQRSSPQTIVEADASRLTRPRIWFQLANVSVTKWSFPTPRVELWRRTMHRGTMR
jgi:hypothetical protein